MKPRPATATALDLRHAHRVAVDAAEAAGRVLRRRSREPLHVTPKGVSGDLVSSLDRVAERVIVQRLCEAFPAHSVLAEEGGRYDRTSSRYVWLVDPLDGTNNLSIGLPAYVVGLALCKDGRPVVGVVHDPIAGRTWSAIRGGGMQVRPDEPSRRRPPALAAAPVLAWTQGHAVPWNDGACRALRFVLDSTARRVLELWAPLLAWVLLSRGDIDGIVGYLPEAIDLPAGALIAQEAGFAVRGLCGGPFDERFDAPAADRSFVAAPAGVIDRLVKVVASAQWIEPDFHRLCAMDRPHW